MAAIKHVGNHNGSKVVIAYRTLPGDPYSALVIHTARLTGSYHDELFSVVDSPAGQDAFELATVLSVRKFSDGTAMLATLHRTGNLQKVPTAEITMTPTPSRDSYIKLDDLNLQIAQQKGVALEDLAIKEKGPSDDEKEAGSKKTIASNYRKRADALYQEMVDLRRRADELDPPATAKKTASKVSA